MNTAIDAALAQLAGQVADLVAAQLANRIADVQPDSRAYKVMPKNGSPGQLWSDVAAEWKKMFEEQRDEARELSATLAETRKRNADLCHERDQMAARIIELENAAPKAQPVYGLPKHEPKPTPMPQKCLTCQHWKQWLGCNDFRCTCARSPEHAVKTEPRHVCEAWMPRA